MFTAGELRYDRTQPESHFVFSSSIFGVQQVSAISCEDSRIPESRWRSSLTVGVSTRPFSPLLILCPLCCHLNADSISSRLRYPFAPCTSFWSRHKHALIRSTRTAPLFRRPGASWTPLTPYHAHISLDAWLQCPLRRCHSIERHPPYSCDSRVNENLGGWWVWPR